MTYEPKAIKIEANFSVKKLLGKGTYGSVFLAKHQEIGRDVAIKVLTDGEGRFEDLQHEAWVQGKLSHPNIVSVYDFTVIDKRGHLVMEYIEDSLQKIFEKCSARQTKVSLEFALRIIKGCVEALAHARYLGVVHGDIKPANILVASNNDPKISDFGVARLLGTPAMRQQGSAKWAAPEVLRSWNKDGVWACDYQSDLFSLGIVAYVLLTGRHPFLDPAGVLSVEQVILDDDIAPVFPTRDTEIIPERYATMTMKLIQRDKRKRYESAEEALADLQERPMEPCSRCGQQNAEDAAYCNWCGRDLKAERIAGLSPFRRTVFVAHDLFVAKQDDQAIAKIEEFLGDEKNRAERWSDLGFTFNAFGWYRDAIIVCSKAIGINDKLASAYQTRGFAESNLGDFNPAINDFTTSLACLDTRNTVKRSQVLSQRGHAYLRLGKGTEACKDGKESLQLDPTNERAAWLVRMTCEE